MDIRENCINTVGADSGHDDVNDHQITGGRDSLTLDQSTVSLKLLRIEADLLALDIELAPLCSISETDLNYLD